MHSRRPTECLWRVGIHVLLSLQNPPAKAVSTTGLEMTGNIIAWWDNAAIPMTNRSSPYAQVVKTDARVKPRSIPMQMGNANGQLRMYGEFTSEGIIVNPQKFAPTQRQSLLRDYQLSMMEESWVKMAKKLQRPLRLLHLVHKALHPQLRDLQQPQHPRCYHDPTRILTNTLALAESTYYLRNDALGENKETILSTFMIGPTLTLAAL